MQCGKHPYRECETINCHTKVVTLLVRGRQQRCCQRRQPKANFGNSRSCTYHSDKQTTRHILVVSERYTSKTCSGCASIDHNLGSKETFTCENHTCGRLFDRDWNASLNILLKNDEQYVGEINNLI
jgi:transposase